MSDETHPDTQDAQAQEPERDREELTDEDLEGVAGGYVPPNKNLPSPFDPETRL